MKASKRQHVFIDAAAGELRLGGTNVCTRFEPGEKTSSSAEQLRCAAIQAGIVGRRAVLLIGGRTVAWKTWELPPVPPDQVGAVVAAQIEASSLLAAEDCSCALQPLPQINNSERRVLGCLVRTDALRSAEGILNEAGISVDAVVPRALIAAKVYSRSSEWEVVALCDGPEYEIAITSNGHVWHAITGRLLTNEFRWEAIEEAIWSCWNTDRQGFRGTVANPARLFILSSGDCFPIPDKSLRLSCPVESKSRTMLESDCRAYLDKEAWSRPLNIRLPVIRPLSSLTLKRTKGSGVKRLAATIAVTVLIAFGLIAQYWLKKQSHLADVAGLEEKHRQILELNEQIRRQTGLVEPTQLWLAQRPKWLDRVDQFGKQLASSPGCEVQSIHMHIGSDDSEAILRIRGQSSSPEAVISLQSQLLKNENAQQLIPYGIRPIDRGGEPSWQFEFELIQQSDVVQRLVDDPIPEEAL